MNYVTTSVRYIAAPRWSMPTKVDGVCTPSTHGLDTVSMQNVGLSANPWCIELSAVTSPCRQTMGIMSYDPKYDLSASRQGVYTMLRRAVRSSRISRRQLTTESPVSLSFRFVSTSGTFCESCGPNFLHNFTQWLSIYHSRLRSLEHTSPFVIPSFRASM
jgi:hypothetical protein